MNQEEKWLLTEKYQGVSCQEFFDDLEKLKLGYPVAYLIGNVPFLNLTIYLDSRPLIPRVETEFWVDLIIKKIKHGDFGTFKKNKILELCSGSGAIGLSFLKNLPTEIVIINEIDSGHHQTILKNINKNNLDTEKIKIIGGDLYEDVDENIKFDFIIANPPYIASGLSTADSNVVLYEPSLALDGGQDGLDIIRRIVAEAKKYLEPTGLLILEHDPWQCNQILEIAELSGFKADFYPDQFNNLRFSILKIIN